MIRSEELSPFTTFDVLIRHLFDRAQIPPTRTSLGVAIGFAVCYPLPLRHIALRCTPRRLRAGDTLNSIQLWS